MQVSMAWRLLWAAVVLVVDYSYAFCANRHHHSREKMHKRILLPATTTTTTRLEMVDGKGMAGGTQHLLGDILRSLQPRYLSQVQKSVQSNLQGMPKVDVEDFCQELNEQANIPSWQELESKLASKDRRVPISASASSKLSSTSKSTIHVTLYRDSAAWCPYCQKVWMALEETKVPYTTKYIDMKCYGTGKPTEFLKLQPNGNLPCAVVESRQDDRTTTTTVIRESNDIIDALDKLSTNPVSLRPSEHEDRIRDLCDNGRDSLERRLFARWMYLLTGVRRPAEYRELFLDHWQEMEDALGETTSGPYFLGREISVVDLRFIPFVERQLASLAYFQGMSELRVDEIYPNIAKWLKAMESRPSYQKTKSDYYTHSRSLPPQLAAECVFRKDTDVDGGVTTPSSLPYNDLQTAIDSLPVGDGISDWVEPGWEWYDGRTAGREAATKLIQGNRKIVTFSARGAGVQGFPAASAPLADPAATPNPDIIPALDLILRDVAHSLALQDGTQNNSWSTIFGTNTFDSSSSSRKILGQAMAGLNDQTRQALVACLDYLRERIGTPRDMTYPAARALRRELLSMKNSLLLPTAPTNTAGSTTSDISSCSVA